MPDRLLADLRRGVALDQPGDVRMPQAVKIGVAAGVIVVGTARRGRNQIPNRLLQKSEKMRH
jgi:hypothetical protein